MAKADISHDYYRELEVAPTADVNEIKKQFRRLILRFHPDSVSGKEVKSDAKWQAILVAREILTDPQQRAKYDNNRIKAGLYHSLPPGGSNYTSFHEVTTHSEDDSTRLLRGTEGTFETLDPSFRIVSDDWRFFVPGRVFATLVWEPVGAALQEVQQGSTLVRYGERTYAKVHRLVVVRAETKEYYSKCIRISTYGGRGASRRGLAQREHMMIYTGKSPPQKLESESNLHKDAIQVIPASPSEKLDPLSRVNLKKVYLVEHNIKVKEIGKVPAKDLRILIAAWRSMAEDDRVDMSQFSEGLTEATEREAAELSLPNTSCEGSKDIVDNPQEKKSALHLAASTGNSTLVRTLLEAGAGTEAKDDVGKTALHYAAERGYMKTAGLLLNSAADIEAKDDVGRTALDLARNNLHEGMKLLLLERGAKLESKDEENLAAPYQSVDNSHQVMSELPGPSVHPPTAIDADLSEGSDADSVHSIESTLFSLSSRSSIYSYTELQTAVTELTTLFYSDKVLGPVFLTALGNKSIRAERLENNFRRLLKQFSTELATEAQGTLEHAAARLVGLHARQIAHEIQRRKQIEFEGKEHTDPPIVPSSYNAEDDDEGHSSDGHELEECDEDNITSLVGVKAFITSSKAFCFLRHKFRRFVQPDMLQSICKEIESEIEMSRLADVTFQVHWDLLDYCKEELEGSPVLAPLLTVTGSAKAAYATTCEEYMNRYWPRSGPDTLKTLQAALGQESYEIQWPSGLRFFVDLSAWHKRSSEKHVTIKVCGSQEYVIEIAQQLAWLSAVFRIPKYGELALSDVVLERIDDEHVKLFLLDLQPVSDKELSCWHTLFVNGVIARGFPIPPRQAEVGVELPFEVMTVLSRVLYPMEYYDGIILKGPSTVLIPTVRYSNSVQWHFISSSIRDERLTTDSIKNYTSEWFETCDFDLLKMARTFLGYCRNAEIHLGTQDLDYTSTKRSDAQRERSRFEVSRKISASLGSSGLGFFGAMFGSEVVYHRGWRATTKAIDMFFEDRLLRAREQPLLLYDTEKKRGWLVPELSVVLHMVHVWASRHPDLSPSTRFDIPHANISANGGMAAWDAIMKGKLIKIRPDSVDGKPQLFIDVIKGFLTALESRKEEIVEREDASSSYSFRRPGLRGWDLIDIVTWKHIFGRKEVPIMKSNSGKWDLIASENPNVIVLFGEGLGEPIKPERHEQLCRKWTSVPEGKCYLTASVQCLEQLAAVHGPPSACPKLTPRLHWYRPSEGKLFEACDFGVGHGCNRLQRLKDRNSNPPGPLEPNGAVIFGKMGKEDGSYCEPLMQRPVEDVDKTRHDDLLSKDSSLAWGHVDRDQVAILSRPTSNRIAHETLYMKHLDKELRYNSEAMNGSLEGSNSNDREDLPLSSGEEDNIAFKGRAFPSSTKEGPSRVQTEPFNGGLDTNKVHYKEGKKAAFLAIEPLMKISDINLTSRRGGKKHVNFEKQPVTKTSVSTSILRMDGKKASCLRKDHIRENPNLNRTSFTNSEMGYSLAIAGSEHHSKELKAPVIRKRPGLDDLKREVI